MLRSSFSVTHGLSSWLRVKRGAEELPAVNESLHDEVSHWVQRAERTSET